MMITYSPRSLPTSSISTSRLSGLVGTRFHIRGRGIRFFYGNVGSWNRNGTCLYPIWVRTNPVVAPGCGGDRLRLGVHNNKFYTHITSIESGGNTVSHVRGRGIRDFYGNVMLRQKRNLYPIWVRTNPAVAPGCGGDCLQSQAYINKFYIHITSIGSGGDTISHTRYRGIPGFYGKVLRCTYRYDHLIFIVNTESKYTKTM